MSPTENNLTAEINQSAEAAADAAVAGGATPEAQTQGGDAESSERSGSGVSLAHQSAERAHFSAEQAHFSAERAHFSAEAAHLSSAEAATSAEASDAAVGETSAEGQS